jgi:anti-sigma factor RsiW
VVSRPFRDDCDESRLRSFLDDGLPEPENARLTAHLDRCAHCRHTLERLAAGSLLWDELRQLSPASDPSA